ncbi:hypothetical protein EVAR_94212_1 [Eumeta japonica]|uniref:Uncharacterized protein n=1 Tax=Eumeta variegata TaxID=151549 RepID=A0A4C1UMZ3_EUMVA|nr:hypothetical protein EVAR_94212_1 [Eumeta japonica]
MTRESLDGTASVSGVRGVRIPSTSGMLETGTKRRRTGRVPLYVTNVVCIKNSGKVQYGLGAYVTLLAPSYFCSIKGKNNMGHLIMLDWRRSCRPTKSRSLELNKFSVLVRSTDEEMTSGINRLTCFQRQESTGLN